MSSHEPGDLRSCNCALLEAEVERLRALFRKVYGNLPPDSAYDNLAREIKRELR